MFKIEVTTLSFNLSYILSRYIIVITNIIIITILIELLTNSRKFADIPMESILYNCDLHSSHILFARRSFP